MGVCRGAVASAAAAAVDGCGSGNVDYDVKGAAQRPGDGTGERVGRSGDRDSDDGERSHTAQVAAERAIRGDGTARASGDQGQARSGYLCDAAACAYFV